MRVFICLLFFTLFSCSSSDPLADNSCVGLEIDASKFDSPNNFGINLIEYVLDESCLHVSLGVSGCDDDHEIDLITNGVLFSSDPLSFLVFDFYDHSPQLCEAYFTLEREFDLSKIRTITNKDVSVQFRNSTISIVFEN
ncbi:MAG: hypothetical protein P1U56_16525 [Saprospiraceae bacterium]|nr:hypothetical protein [Saprospiraceae bacterium]